MKINESLSKEGMYNFLQRRWGNSAAQVNLIENFIDHYFGLFEVISFGDFLDKVFLRSMDGPQNTAK